MQHVEETLGKLGNNCEQVGKTPWGKVLAASGIDNANRFNAQTV
jgi:hypothetical protein